MRHNRKIKNLLFYILFFTVANCYGQYSITGQIDAEQSKIVYLSLLGFNEETMITNEQILFATKTDSNGNFKFEGQLLSEKNKLYRIHSNIREIDGLQLIRDSIRNNYRNFIFSNTDTVNFYSDNSNWFSRMENSNPADLEWHKLKRFIHSFSNDFPVRNKEAREQSSNDLSLKLKRFSNDSLSHPLVKLLAFNDIKSDGFNIENDYKENPEFYRELREELKEYYSGASYYLQFQDELSKTDYLVVQQKYEFHKRLNYILGLLVLVLILFSVFLFQKRDKSQSGEIQNGTEAVSLTSQEQKIARLIISEKSNKEIANELFISLSTVKTHIRNLYAKLNVNSRNELSKKIKNHPGD